MRTQTMVQLTEDLVRRLDDRAKHEGVSRSQLIRDAVEAYLEADAHRRAVVHFHEAYAAMPDTPEEQAVALRNAADMVADEPW